MRSASPSRSATCTRAPGRQPDAHARREHPAARRRRARCRGSRVQPQRRHRDRDGPAHAARCSRWPTGRRSTQTTPPPRPPSALEDRAVGFDYEPGSTFKVVAVSGALQQGLITPQSGFDIPDQIQVADRTIHDDTEHPEETLTTGANPRPIEQRRRDQDRHARGCAGVQPLGAHVRLRRAQRGRTAGRGKRRGAAAGRILGLLDGQPADRPGGARDADADGERLRGDCQRRHPAPAAHRRRGRRPSAARAARAAG